MTATNSSTQTTISLADGTTIPALGLGVWQVDSGSECVDAVRWALEAGYRHIDTAQAYGNEESVGRALRESGVERDQVYITTKFFPRRQDPAAELENSLRRLGVDYVDLYIVHWPEGGPTWAWPGMEAALQRRLTRSVGVSNFDVTELESLFAEASVPPVVNQIQLSPFEYRRALVDAARQHSVQLEAYSPLGTGRHFGNEVVGTVAERLGRTEAQVLIRWALQKGFIVLPKSTHRERIEENAQVFDFTLSDADLAELDALDATDGTATAREDKWWS